MDLNPQSIQKAERRFGLTLPSAILASITPEEEDRLFALRISDMSSSAFSSLFTNFHAIQNIVKNTTQNQSVLVILDSNNKNIEKLIGVLKPDFSHDELLELAKNTNKMWGFRRHFEDASMLQGWFRTFLVADHLRATLWCIEDSTNNELTDISCRPVIFEDGWFVFDTKLESRQLKKKQSVITQNTTTTPIKVANVEKNSPILMPLLDAQLEHEHVKAENGDDFCNFDECRKR